MYVVRTGEIKNVQSFAGKTEGARLLEKCIWNVDFECF